MLRATLCAFLVVAATPLGAQEQKQPQARRPVQIDVALALVLAVDASGSVSNDRFELQKQGYAAAFRNRQVLNSIRSLATQSIAVTNDAVDRSGTACANCRVDTRQSQRECTRRCDRGIDAATIRRRHLD